MGEICEIPYSATRSHTVVVKILGNAIAPPPQFIQITTEILVRYLLSQGVRYLDSYHDENRFCRGVRETADIPRSSPCIAWRSRLFFEVLTRSFEGRSFLRSCHNLRISVIRA
jgi:hypothetical protein